MTWSADSNRFEGFRWRCQRRVAGNKCNQSVSIKDGSWFQQSNLTFQEILLITYDIMCRVQAHQIQRKYRLSAHAVADWGYSVKTGGPQKTVKILQSSPTKLGNLLRLLFTFLLITCGTPTRAWCIFEQKMGCVLLCFNTSNVSPVYTNPLWLVYSTALAFPCTPSRTRITRELTLHSTHGTAAQLALFYYRCAHVIRRACGKQEAS